MTKQIDLTTGGITEKLLKLALPIMGVSFIQMAYNLIDMIWIGRAGSEALAAVGTAGFFSWLAEAFILITKLGVSIKVAQSIGEKKHDKVKHYIVSALQMNCIIALLYGSFLIFFNKQLIAFFHLGSAHVEQMGRTYLITVACGMLFFFSGPVFTGIFNGMGDSKTPFKINTIGLIVNIILDPILIFGCFGLPKLGVFGAALATVIAQFTVAASFVIVILKKKSPDFSLNIWVKPNGTLMGEMARIGLPGALQSGLFTSFSIIIGRIVAVWGPGAIAAQKVGAQIESITWLTAEGFAVAMASYVGQNYGAGKKERIEKGVHITLWLAAAVGIFSTCVLIGGREQLMHLFITEKETVGIGMSYLAILGVSQLFMCLEITITGAFNGLGRTYLPNSISIIFTGLRIPLALLLSSRYGLIGVWMSISGTSVIKGILLVGVYHFLYKTGRLYKKEMQQIEA